MKEKIKKFLKNPVFKSIFSLIASIFSFLLIRFNGTSIIDGLISGFGLIVFCFSLFFSVFSLCEAISLFAEKDRERKKMKKIIEKLLKLFENPYRMFIVSLTGVFFASFIEYCCGEVFWNFALSGLGIVLGFILFIISFTSLILSSIFMYLKEKEKKREEIKKEDKEKENEE